MHICIICVGSGRVNALWQCLDRLLFARVYVAL